MPITADRKLKVFLCHAKEDKPTVRDLYRQLTAAPQGGDKGWMDVWLDEMNLLPVRGAAQRALYRRRRRYLMIINIPTVINKKTDDTQHSAMAFSF